MNCGGLPCVMNPRPLGCAMTPRASFAGPRIIPPAAVLSCAAPPLVGGYISPAVSHASIPLMGSHVPPVSYGPPPMSACAGSRTASYAGPPIHHSPLQTGRPTLGRDTSKDLLSMGQVVNERPVSREELAASGHLSEGREGLAGIGSPTVSRPTGVGSMGLSSHRLGSRPANVTGGIGGLPDSPYLGSSRFSGSRPAAVGGGISGGFSNGISGGLSNGISGGVGGGLSNGIGGGLGAGRSNGISGGLSNGIGGGLGAGRSSGISGGLSNGISGGISGGLGGGFGSGIGSGIGTRIESGSGGGVSGGISGLSSRPGNRPGVSGGLHSLPSSRLNLSGSAAVSQHSSSGHTAVAAKVLGGGIKAY
eukprot:CAMPEP_0194495210 /NCGR_PEP_ID=MMETSP0253-20130528/12886_1 /TAXON_ID=2966 /ORGANISM="Noctiluca scintillans" /LENGTH=362 /DNA_ID=CAMNT_0039336439 /DNA_START=108 /DNA_END=1196 /DNA_ORIENTATION=+